MAPTVPTGLRALARSGVVLVGVLLLGVGLADLGAGLTKVAEYRAVLAESPPPRRHPEKLFPTATEAEQRRAIAQAKLGYYQLLVLAGQVLAASGVVLIGIGALRTRLAALREEPGGVGVR